MMAMSAAAALSILMYFGGSYIYILFTKDELVIKKGMEILRFLVPTFFTYVSIEILSGSLRGMGNALIPMLLTCFGVCVLRMIWIITVVPFLPDIKTVIFSYPLSWTITSIMFIIYFKYYSRKHPFKERTLEPGGDIGFM
jgi:Na+-driven multidrug efflux pump